MSEQVLHFSANFSGLCIAFSLLLLSSALDYTSMIYRDQFFVTYYEHNILLCAQSISTFSHRRILFLIIFVLAGQLARLQSVAILLPRYNRYFLAS